MYYINDVFRFCRFVFRSRFSIENFRLFFSLQTLEPREALAFDNIFMEYFRIVRFDGESKRKILTNTVWLPVIALYCAT